MARGGGVMDFMERVMDELEYRGLKRSDLARYLGVSYSTVQTWHVRHAIPSVETAYKVAQFLGVTVEYLITGENPTPRNVPKNATFEIYNNHDTEIKNKVYKTVEKIKEVAEPLRLNDSADFEYIFKCYQKMDGHDRDTVLNIVTALMSHYPDTETEAN